MNCIFKRCAHAGAKRCDLLGECGARRLLRLAQQPGGQVAIYNGNETLSALQKVGLVSVASIDSRFVRVTARSAA